MQCIGFIPASLAPCHSFHALLNSPGPYGAEDPWRKGRAPNSRGGRGRTGRRNRGLQIQRIAQPQRARPRRGRWPDGSVAAWLC
jgi:hypothetical protein